MDAPTKNCVLKSLETAVNLKPTNLFAQPCEKFFHHHPLLRKAGNTRRAKHFATLSFLQPSFLWSATSVAARGGARGEGSARRYPALFLDYLLSFSPTHCLNTNTEATFTRVPMS